MNDKNILLGISAGIAAYKCYYLIRLLRKQGANVKTVITKQAKHFVSPLVLQALSGAKVEQHIFSDDPFAHIKLAKWADLYIIVPATADLIAHIAHGFANDIVSAISLCIKCPFVIVPAMNEKMYLSSATQDNIKTLLSRKILIWGPNIGKQACGDFGIGRMLEPEEIYNMARKLLCKETCNMKVVVTAGPTKEAIDSVRFISNHSSGKMGFSIASKFADIGADTYLISGPVSLSAPYNVKKIDVTTALQMQEAVKEHACDCNIFVGCAAVSDYRVKNIFKGKIKKTQNTLNIELVKNPDIIRYVSMSKKRPFVVGFASETENIISNAKQKLEYKKMDIICANDVSKKDIGFDKDYNACYFITNKMCTYFPKENKDKLAEKIVLKIIEEYKVKYERQRH